MEYKFRVYCDDEMHYDDLGAFIGFEGMEIVEVHGKLMQSTGIKDKHGKDIYEGDIVAGKYPWEIIFKNGGFKAKQIGVGYTCFLAELYDIEIIGNIHTTKITINDIEPKQEG